MPAASLSAITYSTEYVLNAMSVGYFHGYFKEALKFTLPFNKQLHTILCLSLDNYCISTFIAAFQPHQSQEWGGLDIVPGEDSGDAAREQPGDEPRTGLVPDWLRISGLVLQELRMPFIFRSK